MNAAEAEIRIATWNVNSLRVRLEALLAWLARNQPQVLCLQETKVQDELFPLDALREAGYEAVFMGQKTYNGVAILSSLPIENVKYGFDGSGQEEQKRLIAATVGGIRIVNAYIPNGGSVESERFGQKLAFLEQLSEYFAHAERPGQPVLFTGDFNVAPEERDVYDPLEMAGQVCFHREEQLRLAVVRRWGFVDAFRQLEAGGGHHSWWDFRTRAFERDAGLRIDHIWVTLPLEARLRACWIDKAERGLPRASDHAPVVASFSAPVD